MSVVLATGMARQIITSKSYPRATDAFTAPFKAAAITAAFLAVAAAFVAATRFLAAAVITAAERCDRLVPVENYGY